MKSYRDLLRFLKHPSNHVHLNSYRRYSHRIPFVELYQRTTGKHISKDTLPQLKKKHPHIDTLSEERLQSTLQTLKKFGISDVEACQNPHLFTMNPISMDNYGEILKECGFVNIMPNYIIRYHTIVRSRTVEQLKKKGLMKTYYVLEKELQDLFEEWPSSSKTLQNFSDSSSSILTVRMSVLEKYLHWRLSVTSEEFRKYCRNYLPLKHRPMSDIREALNIAQHDIQFDTDSIKRNGFVISSDPINTRMIIENVKVLGGMDIREAIRIEPAILKNNPTAILQIRSILEEYRISEEAQKNCFKVYCMRPQTVLERLEELKKLKEFQVLSTNPRALAMVIHKKKLMSRLSQIQESKKQCYSLNNLVASSKVFNNYISGFGNKVCGRDIAILISSSVNMDNNEHLANLSHAELTKAVVKNLKRHRYWLHAALSVVDENISFLKEKFDNDVIFNHCQVLLYPITEIKHYLDHLLMLREGTRKVANIQNSVKLDHSYNNLKCSDLTDNQILSLVLYEIEKKYHFSGDGIWASQEGLKAESQNT